METPFLHAYRVGLTSQWRLNGPADVAGNAELNSEERARGDG